MGMVRARVHLFIFLAFLAASSSQAAQHQAVVVQFRAKGIVCAMCVQGLKKRLLSEEGVQSVDIDLPSRKVRLLVDQPERFTLEFLKKTVEDAGFAFDQIDSN